MPTPFSKANIFINLPPTLYDQLRSHPMFGDALESDLKERVCEFLKLKSEEVEVTWNHGSNDKYRYKIEISIVWESREKVDDFSWRFPENDW